MGDFLLAGPNKRTKLAKIKMMSLVECEEMGELKEYIECKIERNWNEIWVKLTKPIMVQSFKDKLKLDAHGKYLITPAEPGKLLSKVENNNTVYKEE